MDPVPRPPIRPPRRFAAEPAAIVSCIAVGVFAAVAVIIGHERGHRFAFEALSAYVLIAGLLSSGPQGRRPLYSLPSWSIGTLVGVPIGLLVGGLCLPLESSDPDWRYAGVLWGVLLVMDIGREAVRDRWAERRREMRADGTGESPGPRDPLPARTP
ncbi:hypothetical protein [Glycomyces paridis]|uniref:Uncharacterized protein n=1 Tax=Glycomyces paridis TaxID=2126555 RepID=A0A4S8P0K4_9ACTN|nr:hypothetical protein [Glycomyces paridis]THV23478.1 hypothetical protein E9998_23035 [Glycomyces paridis]